MTKLLSHCTAQLRTVLHCTLTVLPSYSTSEKHDFQVVANIIVLPETGLLSHRAARCVKLQ
jgi:hypothetical protein